jgi:ribosomal protein S18 acetylase RimI-like enzyme
MDSPAGMNELNALAGFDAVVAKNAPPGVVAAGGEGGRTMSRALRDASRRIAGALLRRSSLSGNSGVDSACQSWYFCREKQDQPWAIFPHRRVNGMDAAEHKLTIRNLRESDYEDIDVIMEQAYSGMGGGWTREEISRLLTIFPEGQICIEDKGRAVAAALTLMVDYSTIEDVHSYDDIVDEGRFSKNDLEGDYLYGIDVFVHKDYRGMRLGRRLYDARKELCGKLNLKGIVVGGRIPGYGRYAREMTPDQYIEKVRKGEIVDQVLTFQLSNDFHPKRALRNYIPEDSRSRSYAVLLEWNNIFYEGRKRVIWGRKSNVRLGAVQWQMRPFNGMDDLLQQVEFFVDAVSGYKVDLLLFPEMFNAPLLADYDQQYPPMAMRSLAELTDRLREVMLEMAMKYNTNIVAGSLPVCEDGKLFNAAFLCRRDGTWDAQYKLHVTPDEKQYWGLQGGRSSGCSIPI